MKNSTPTALPEIWHTFGNGDLPTFPEACPACGAAATAHGNRFHPVTYACGAAYRRQTANPKPHRQMVGRVSRGPMTALAFTPADIADVPIENMLRAMIDNAANAIIVHIDGIEYEVRLRRPRVNRAPAPKPQHGCPCALHIHS